MNESERGPLGLAFHPLGLAFRLRPLGLAFQLQACPRACSGGEDEKWKTVRRGIVRGIVPVRGVRSSTTCFKLVGV